MTVKDLNSWNDCYFSIEKDDLDFAAKMIAKLFILCSPKREDCDKVFRRMNTSRIVDYMGSGFPFVDAFERLYNEYCENVSEPFHTRVKKYIDEIKA